MIIVHFEVTHCIQIVSVLHSHSVGNFSLSCNSPHYVNSLNSTRFGIFLKLITVLFFLP